MCRDGLKIKGMTKWGGGIGRVNRGKRWKGDEEGGRMGDLSCLFLHLCTSMALHIQFLWVGAGWRWCALLE